MPDTVAEREVARPHIWVISLRSTTFDSRFERFVETVRQADPNPTVFGVSDENSTFQFSTPVHKWPIVPKTKIRKLWALVNFFVGGPTAYYAARFSFAGWLKVARELTLPSVILTFDTEALAFAQLYRNRLNGAASTRIFADLHEYYPEESAVPGPSSFLKKLILHKWLRGILPEVDLLSCTGDNLAKKFQEQFGVSPMVIPNTPRFVNSSLHGTGEVIKFVYHGYFSAQRGYETLLEAFHESEKSHELHLVVAPSQFLEAQRFVENFPRKKHNVTVHEFVAPSELVDFLTRFDVEIIPTAPNCANHELLLPNKLFEAMMARLAIVSTPLPNVAKVVGQWDCGLVASGFRAKDLLVAIDSLTPPEIDRMKGNSARAIQTLNWERGERTILAALKPLGFPDR